MRKMLYKKGGNVLVWGKKLATCIVTNEEDLKKKIKDGWSVHPEKIKETKPDNSDQPE